MEKAKSLFKKNKILVYITASIVALALGLMFLKRSQNNWVAPFRGEVTEAVYGLGKVKSDRRYEVKVSVPATIKNIFVQEGDSVKKGQKILDTDSVSISSPIAGVVTFINVYTGETAVANNVLMRIEDLTDTFIELTLEQDGALRVRPNQEVKISFESLRNQKLSGKVENVFSRNDEFIAQIRAAQMPPNILPGMTADVSIEIGKVNGLLVPYRAVRDGQVTIKRLGKTKKIKVEVGLVDGLQAEILNNAIQAEDLVLIPKE